MPKKPRPPASGGSKYDARLVARGGSVVVPETSGKKESPGQKACRIVKEFRAVGREPPPQTLKEAEAYLAEKTHLAELTAAEKAAAAAASKDRKKANEIRARLKTPVAREMSDGAMTNGVAVEYDKFLHRCSNSHVH